MLEDIKEFFGDYKGLKVTPQGHGLGWHPSIPDQRDFMFSAPYGTLTALPTLVDLRTTGCMPPVWDQGQLGSCTAHGSLAAFIYEMAKQKESPFEPSRLFQYYNSRLMEGTTSYDAGASVRDAVAALSQYGVIPETEMPYDISTFTTAPTTQEYTDAKLHTALQYAAVPQDLMQMKGALASGSPIVIGFTVYTSFEDGSVAQTGIVPMPAANEATLGGHCVLVVGYDDSRQMFIVRNSWSTNWGIQGYCYFPYLYLTNPSLSDDFWVVTLDN